MATVVGARMPFTYYCTHMANSALKSLEENLSIST